MLALVVILVYSSTDKWVRMPRQVLAWKLPNQSYLGLARPKLKLTIPRSKASVAGWPGSYFPTIVSSLMGDCPKRVK
jgi:hypothetical protein